MKSQGGKSDKRRGWSAMTVFAEQQACFHVDAFQVTVRVVCAEWSPPDATERHSSSWSLQSNPGGCIQVHNTRMSNKTTSMLLVALLTGRVSEMAVCSLRRLLFGLRLAAIDTTLVISDDPQHEVWVIPHLLTKIPTDFHTLLHLPKSQKIANVQLPVNTMQLGRLKVFHVWKTCRQVLDDTNMFMLKWSVGCCLWSKLCFPWLLRMA